MTHDYQSMTQKAFLDVYDRFADAIFRYALVRIGDRDLAQDIMQETFFKTWSYVCDGGEVKQVRPFLYRTARNLIVDHARKKKMISLEALVEEGVEFTGDVRNHPEEITMHRDVLRVMQSLDEAYREVLLLRYVEGLSIAEIASVIEESKNVVSVRIHRGIQKIKAHYHE